VATTAHAWSQCNCDSNSKEFGQGRFQPGSNKNSATQQLFAILAIFEARQRRLQSQVIAFDRIASHQQFMDRIGTNPGCIVGIWISASDGHHSLRDQVD
jgi:hypothetical protein